MINCAECGAKQFDGALFCSECGASMMDSNQTTKMSSPTASPFGDSSLPFSEEETGPSAPSLVGQQLSKEKGVKQIMFVLPGSGRQASFEAGQEIRMGRVDPHNGIHPELDLTVDRGDELGVSRMHAVVQSSSQGFVLVDLGSTNGTFLNNYRIPADLPYPLQNGDEVRLGQLLIHVFVE